MSYRNIPFGQIEAFNVIVEIPQGSNLKYEYDEKSDSLKLDFVFENLNFPFNYGFLPKTLGGDGDPLDAVILSAKPLKMGDIVKCKAVGLVEMLDRGEQDNKIIAVPINDPLAQTYQDFADLPKADLESWKVFWTEVGKQKNKIMEVKGFRDKNVAEREIAASLFDIKRQLR